ncbi:MAG: serine/threonine protein kinase [Myxococcales bacterium]|nr:serine/threonine protein kinase [Myxococcales bacterium]
MSAASDTPGSIVDAKYALIEQIGAGGMGTVWRALVYGAEGFRRTVAVKRLNEAFNDYPEVVQMFVEEARVGAMLRHPNVVQIHDFGIDSEGQYYLVTEWVEGIHFGDYQRSFTGVAGGTPWPLITAIAIEVLRALDAAHGARNESGKRSPVLHRDVSPPNILLDVTGIVKLADFGLARAMDRGRITQPNVIKGKLSYLAPEMLRGEEASVQSDLFSLGVCLWEALAGQRLFDAPTDIQVLAMLRDPRVPLLSVKRPDLPMGLTTAVHRALERDPKRRFDSALQMLESLREVLRVIPESTSGPVLAASIEAARDRIRKAPR